jgi:hypothetical protein
MPRLFDLLFIIGLGSSAWGNALNLWLTPLVAR